MVNVLKGYDTKGRGGAMKGSEGGGGAADQGMEKKNL